MWNTGAGAIAVTIDGGGGGMVRRGGLGSTDFSDLEIQTLVALLVSTGLSENIDVPATVVTMEARQTLYIPNPKGLRFLL
ncbi:Hypothetical predicted protein [Olea europaea subsp. europaea]|uniref:Uncharacterized protein n=1 Tax=Olea europaea subsp. europaea TaxID=158383 RepID=A0A8S0U8G3_OLEEU|nr:Hypothetical predicted protein [Olea europaea subsp. europaea]